MNSEPTLILSVGSVVRRHAIDEHEAIPLAKARPIAFPLVRRSQRAKPLDHVPSDVVACRRRGERDHLRDAAPCFTDTSRLLGREPTATSDAPVSPEAAAERDRSCELPSPRRTRGTSNGRGLGMPRSASRAGQDVDGARSHARSVGSGEARCLQSVVMTKFSTLVAATVSHAWNPLNSDQGIKREDIASRPSGTRWQARALDSRPLVHAKCTSQHAEARAESDRRVTVHVTPASPPPHCT